MTPLPSHSLDLPRARLNAFYSAYCPPRLAQPAVMWEIQNFASVPMTITAATFVSGASAIGNTSKIGVWCVHASPPQSAPPALCTTLTSPANTSPRSASAACYWMTLQRHVCKPEC